MKRSFQSKLFILFITSILLPLLVMSSFLSFYFNNRSIRTSEQNIFNTLYTVSQNIRIYLDDLKRVSLSPNVYPDVMNFYEQLNRGDADDSYPSYLIRYKYRTLMQQLLTLSRSDIKGIAFIPLNNPDSIIYSIDTHTGVINNTTNYNYKDKPWYNLVKESRGTPVFSLSGEAEYYEASISAGLTVSNEKNIFSVMRLVCSDDYKRYIGIIKVDASSAVIRDIFNNISTSAHSGLLLLDHNDDVVYSTRESLNPLSKSLNTGITEIATVNGSFYCYIQPIPNTTWRLV